MPAKPLPEPSETQLLLLQGLHRHVGLTTRQVKEYVLPSLSAQQAYRELVRLRAWEWVRSTPLRPTEGRSELYWTIRPAGARLIGRPYTAKHDPYRIPGHNTLQHKALVLEISTILEEAGWEYLPPQPYNNKYPKPAQTGQRTRIQYAVEHHYNHTPAEPPGAGRSLPAVLHPSNVPAGLNDWVAWHPREPERTIILILPPPNAGRDFWHYPSRNRRATHHTSGGRAQLYAALAPILPVLAVFPTPAAAAPYAALLERAHFHVCTPNDILRFLARRPL